MRKKFMKLKTLQYTKKNIYKSNYSYCLFGDTYKFLYKFEINDRKDMNSIVSSRSFTYVLDIRYK